MPIFGCKDVGRCFHVFGVWSKTQRNRGIARLSLPAVVVARLMRHVLERLTKMFLVCCGKRYSYTASRVYMNLIDDELGSTASQLSPETRSLFVAIVI